MEDQLKQAIQTESEPSLTITYCPDCGEALSQTVDTEHFGPKQFPRACACERAEALEAEQAREARRRRMRAGRIREAFFMDPDQTFGVWDHAQQPAMDPVYDRVLMFAQGFASREPEHGLLLRGEKKGVGKSHLLTAIANHLLDQGIPAVSMEFVLYLEGQRPTPALTGEERAWRRHMVQAAPYLAINDISRFSPKEWSLQELLVILEARAARKLCTCASANQPISDWAASAMSELGAKKGSRIADLIDGIRSRIEGACNLVRLPDPELLVDYRSLQRKDREQAEEREGLR